MIDARLDALFVSPHPDDVEIFAGGTVARLGALGYRVAIVDLTRGELGTNGTPEQRREESLVAAEILGTTGPRVALDLGDGALDDADPAQVRALVELLRAQRPRLVFGPCAVDRHPDHEAAARLLRRANFLAGLSNVAADGRPHRAQRICSYLGHLLRPPSFLVDVTTTMERRRQAIAAYRSQFTRGADDRETPINRPGFLPGLEARLAALGQEVGVEYAEPFVTESPPLMQDPVSQLTRGDDDS